MIFRIYHSTMSQPYDYRKPAQELLTSFLYPSIVKYVQHQNFFIEASSIDWFVFTQWCRAITNSGLEIQDYSTVLSNLQIYHKGCIRQRIDITLFDSRFEGFSSLVNKFLPGWVVEKVLESSDTLRPPRAKEILEDGVVGNS